MNRRHVLLSAVVCLAAVGAVSCTPPPPSPCAASTLAGKADAAGSADGTGSAARFRHPFAVAVDKSNSVYVADFGNNTIRRVTTAGVVTTVAGSAGAAGSADGSGTAARFRLPAAVATDGSGGLFVADTYNYTIRKISASGVVTTLAGSPGAVGSADGTGAAARFDLPAGLAVDESGTLYVADRNNHTIRKVTATGVVTTLAGSAGNPGSADGTGAAARFDLPFGVAVDDQGVVYVADWNNHTIRKVTAAGVVSTLAGAAGLSGCSDGTGTAARFDLPRGVAVDDAGNVYVADTDNHVIRRVD